MMFGGAMRHLSFTRFSIDGNLPSLFSQTQAELLIVAHLTSSSRCFSIRPFHSFNMLMVGNLRMNLCRRCAVPTGPTLPRASLHRLPSGIIRIPLVTRRTNSSASSSKLTISGELENFPLSISDFSQIREPGFAYFDKTSHIARLEKESAVKLVCRPSRFGKSLTITMLRYFHGVQYREEYDKLFKVCGPRMLLDTHITNTHIRISMWIAMSGTTLFSQDSISF